MCVGRSGRHIPPTKTGGVTRVGASGDRLILRVPTLVALLCAVFGTPALSRPVTPDDLYRIVTVSSPRVSPDGNWVAYVASTPSREKDADNDDLWMVSWNGREHRHLTVFLERLVDRHFTVNELSAGYRARLWRRASAARQQQG